MLNTEPNQKNVQVSFPNHFQNLSVPVCSKFLLILEKRRRKNAFWLLKPRSCATMHREGQSSNLTCWIACLPQSKSLNQQHWIVMMTGRIWKGRKVVLVLKMKNKSIKLLSYFLSKDWRICTLKELIIFTFTEKGWMCDLSVKKWIYIKLYLILTQNLC